MNVYKPHVISSNVAPTILDYLERGPVALYRSINLSNPGASWLVPAGNGRPTWEASNEPERLLTKNDFVVTKDIEVKRFHIAVRLSGNGLAYKLTDGSSRRVRSAVSKAGDGAYYKFDGDDAVIFKPEGPAIPLEQWATHE